VKLTIESVSKQYNRGVWGLRDFSLEIGPGVLGLLGPNGAGKTTLMRILATVTRPTEGCATWNGVDIAKSPEALRSELGYLPQDFGVYPNLNAMEFLEYLAALKGLSGRPQGCRDSRGTKAHHAGNPYHDLFHPNETLNGPQSPRGAPSPSPRRESPVESAACCNGRGRLGRSQRRGSATRHKQPP